MPDLTTKDGLLERMVAATETLATDVPAKFNEYLPLEGGTMTGPISGNPLTLTADDGNGTTASMVLNPNGVATWEGKDIDMIDSSGTGWIRYKNGIQIVFGTTTMSADGGATGWTGTYYSDRGWKEIPFPQAFIDTPSCHANVIDNGNYWTANVAAANTTTLKIYLMGNSSTAEKTVNYTCIGYWK